MKNATSLKTDTLKITAPKVGSSRNTVTTLKVASSNKNATVKTNTTKASTAVKTANAQQNTKSQSSQPKAQVAAQNNTTKNAGGLNKNTLKKQGLNNNKANAPKATTTAKTANAQQNTKNQSNQPKAQAAAQNNATKNAGALNKNILSNAAIENILKKQGLENNKALLRKSQTSGQALSFAVGAAGWHGAGDIQTLDGLAGTYFWHEQFFAPAFISFTFASGQEGSAGTYKISGLSAEQGTFSCVPNNPAIGSAIISLTPKNGNNQRSFVVQGVATGSNWKIFALALSRITSNSVQLPFFNQRIFA